LRCEELAKALDVNRAGVLTPEVMRRCNNN